MLHDNRPETGNARFGCTPQSNQYDDHCKQVAAVVMAEAAAAVEVKAAVMVVAAERAAWVGRGCRT